MYLYQLKGYEWMKVLDVQEVIDAIDQIKEAKQRDSENIETLRASIQKIQHLESLQGEGGDAIKDHFARLHVPVLEAFHLVIRQYIEQLDIIRSNLLGFESSSAIVREEFLTNDIKNGLDRIETTATEDATGIESIRTSISDILSLPSFSMETVLGHVDRGKDHAAETVEKLHALDEENEALLGQAESTLQEVTTVVNQVANWSSGGAILSADTLAEIDANLESLYSNLVTEAIHMAPDTYTIDQNGQVISSYQNALPLEFLTTGAYANIPGGLKAMSWYYMNHLPVSAMVNDEQAIQACLAPVMEGHTVVTSRYQQAINLFSIQNGLLNETTVSLVQLNQQMHRLFPVQYEWMQAQLYTEMHSGSYQARPVQSGAEEWSNVNAFNDGVSGNQVKAGGDHDFTDEEVAGIQEYLKNGGSSTNNVEMTDEEAYAGLTNDVRVGHRADGQSYQSNINMFMPAAEFVFGDFVTLIDANASGLDKAMAATFILVKPVKVAEMGYDLARVRKVGSSSKPRVVNGFEAVSHSGKQGKHIPGHSNYQQGKSIFTGDSQRLLDRHAGTGEWVGQNRERVNFGETIGKWVDLKTGKEISTTNGIIHYSKKGAHIVPARPN